MQQDAEHPETGLALTQRASISTFSSISSLVPYVSHLFSRIPPLFIVGVGVQKISKILHLRVEESLRYQNVRQSEYFQNPVVGKLENRCTGCNWALIGP